MSNYSKKDLDYFANKTLENYDSKNPSLIFKEKIKITNDDALLIQSNVAELRKKRGEEIVGYKIGCVSKDTQKKMGFTQPACGYLWKSELYNSGVVLNKKNYSSNFVCLKSCYGFEDVKAEVEFTVIHSEFCVINKNFLFKIGGWKSYKNAGGEEFELGQRILKSGKKIILIKKAYYTTYYNDIFTRFKKITNSL